MTYEFLSKSIVLDTNALAHFLGNDTSVMRRFINLFLMESPKIVNQIDEALQIGDFSAVMNDVHILKGQLKYFGLSDQTNLLQEIETAAETGANCAQLPELWRIFTASFSEIYQQIKAL